MSRLLQNMNIPKLAKTKQLQNPYQSSTTTCSQLSRIFLLNDRSKIRLTQQSDSQSNNSEGQECRINHNRSNNGSPRLNRWVSFQNQNKMDIMSCNIEPASHNNTQPSIPMSHEFKFQQPSTNNTFNIHSPVIDKKLPTYVLTPDQIQKQKSLAIKNNKNETPQFTKQQSHTDWTNEKLYQITQQRSRNKQQQQNRTHEFWHTIKQSYTYQDIKYETKKPKNIQSSRFNVDRTQPISIAPAQKQTSANKFLSFFQKIESEQNHNNNPKTIIKISKSSQKNNPNKKIKEDQQQIAAQQDTESLLNISPKKHEDNFNLSMAHSYKPSLHECSQVFQDSQQKQGYSNVKKGSIIDKIKLQGFVESRVVDQIASSNNQHQTHISVGKWDKNTIKPVKQDHINQNHNNNNSNMKQMQQQTKLRKRTKIFTMSQANKTNQTPVKQVFTCEQTTTKQHSQPSQQQQKTKMFTAHETAQDRVNTYYNTHVMSPQQLDSNSKRARVTSPERQSSEFEPMPINNINNNNNKVNENNGAYYAVCPHTQCILKSLHIIDKLTDNPPYSSRSHHHANQQTQNNNNHNNTSRYQDDHKSDKKQKSKQLQLQIQAQVLDVSMEMDNLLAGITLADLLNQQTGVKIRRFKSQIQSLIFKIKQTDQYTIHTSPLQSFQLTTQMQRICKILHYLLITQQRYRMWRTRLHHLSERITDILTVNRTQQNKKLADIVQHIAEMETSKFYGTQANQIGILQAYNQYITKQIQQLRDTVQCIKIVVFNKHNHNQMPV